MSDKKVSKRGTLNHMSRVKCPKTGAVQWANSTAKGPKCTSCGLTGHDKAHE